MMNAKVLSFLIVLGTCWCCSARLVTSANMSPLRDAIASELQINNQQRGLVDENMCAFCEVVLTPIIEGLSNTTAQTEVMAFLHLICAWTFIAKDECNAVVDHYVPQIISGASTSTPEELCKKVGLCECTDTSRHLSEYSCESCHHAVSKASSKFSNPNNQLHLVGLFLKVCSTMGNSVNNYCKRLVLGNALLIPVYQQMLEGHSICNLLYDCSSPTNVAEEEASSYEKYLDSSY